MQGFHIIRRYGFGLLIQILGQVSGFALVFLIATIGGPSAQGEFAGIKSISDLIVSIFLLGMPQTFIYAINSGGISAVKVARFIFGYNLVLLGALPFVILGFNQLNITIGDSFNSIIPILAISLFISGNVFLLLFRSLILTIKGGLSFSVLTALPAVSLLICIPLGIKVLPSSSMALYFAAAAMINFGATAAIWIQAREKADDSEATVNFRMLITHSFHAFIQTIIINLSVFITLKLLEIAGATIADIGRFHLAAIIWAAFMTFLGMIAPQLYNEWSKMSWSEAMQQISKAMYLLIPLAIVISFIGFLTVGDIIEFAFGSGYAGSKQAAQIFMLGFPLILMSQTFAPLVLSAGRPSILSVVSIMRLIVMLIAFYLVVQYGAQPIIAASWSWVIAEAMAVITLSIAIHRVNRN